MPIKATEKEPRLSAPGIPARRRPQPPARSFAAGRSILALALREMSTRYGRTAGGYVWAVLEPVGALAVMAVAFAVVFHAPPLGNSFILFYASGYLPYLIFANISAQVQGAIQFSRPLLEYPAVAWIDAILARFLLNLLTGIAVFAIVLTGILQFTEARTTLEFGPIIVAVLLAAGVGLGIGTLNCLLAGLFETWAQVWSILTRPLFLISGIFFVFEDMPPLLQDILWYTPWIHITGIARTGIYPTYAADYASVLLVLAWAMVPLFLGLVLLGRYHKDILNR